MSDIILNFGKHTGKKLSEVPHDYLEWLAQQDIRKQPEIAQAAKAFLNEHPASMAAKPRSHEPGTKPLYYRDASKLGWMAGKRYGNARATMLAARDHNGLLCVLDEEAEDERDCYRLLEVREDGTIMDASFYGKSYAEVEAILKQYPQFDGSQLLEDVAESEKMEADERRRSLTFKSSDGEHTVRLVIWSAECIAVSIDGREAESYQYRLPNEKERKDTRWKVAAAVLEHEYFSEGAENIGLMPERKMLVEEKLQELGCTTQP